MERTNSGTGRGIILRRISGNACNAVLVFLLMHQVNVFGQSYEVSKSRKVKTPVDDQLIEAQENTLSDPKKAFDIVAGVLASCIRENDQLCEAKSYRTLAKMNFSQKLYPKAIDYLDKSMDLFLKLKVPEELYSTRKLLAEALESNINYARALEEWNKVLNEARIRKNEDDVVLARDRIAAIYERQGMLDLAYQNQIEALQLEKNRGNYKGMIIQNNKLGDILVQQNKTDEAIARYSESESIATEKSSNDDLAETYQKLGSVYRKDKQYNAEFALRAKSIDLFRSQGNLPALNSQYLETGRMFLESGNYREAISYFNESITLSEQLAIPVKQAEALKGLSEAFGKLELWNHALANYRKYVAVMDLIYNEKEQSLAAIIERNREVSESQAIIESLEKDMELNAKTIEILRQEQQLKAESMNTQRVIIYSLIAGLIGVAVASWLLYRSSRRRRIANQLLALKSLRSQMNPHFIFNALNSVNSFISQNDERSANKYLSEFSRLMRAVMENSQSDFVPLSTELRILELYLSLEHFRFRDRFDYEFKVDPLLDADSVMIPPMLIQPYIENAVWHGLRYKEEKGFLTVKLERTEGELIAVVEDNGIGRARSQELKTPNQKQSISTGLRNIQNRISIINSIHGTRLSVRIDDLEPETGAGTRVEIRLPLQIEESVHV